MTATASPSGGSGRVDVLGVGVSATTLSDAAATIEGWIAQGAREYVCVTGMHGVMESQRDAALLGIHNAAGLVTPDGMSLVWVSRWKGYHEVSRVYGPDLMLALCERSPARGYRHFLYGGSPQVLDRLIERLQARFPGLSIVGSLAPPFRPTTEEEGRSEVARINAAAPDFVWVGLGTPKQEQWMARQRPLLQAPVLIGVGAAFDFHAGTKAQAPRWMQRSGLEWLFRLLSEPRRLWRRYLTNIPLFAGYLLLDALGLRRRRPVGAGRARP